MANDGSRQPLIVVGVDGSKQSAAVLRWAVNEARTANARVRAVLAWRFPQPPDYVPFRVESELSEAAEKLLDRLVAATGDGITIESVVKEGSAVPVLLREARKADLLVVGRHGDGHDGSKLIGAVAQTCVVQAPCPVVVVPLDEPAA